MPVITAIKKQKRKKDRVNVYLDGEFGFGIDLENLLKFNLKVEKELTKEEIEKILEEAEYKDIRDKLLNYATLRPRSEKEIDDWFYKKKVHESMHKRLKDKLRKLDLLDDEEFAKWWVSQRQEFKPRGPKLLYAELLNKGIDKKIISKAIEEQDIEGIKVAYKLLEKKSYRWKNKDIKTKKKMTDFLARKGFKWDAIRRAVDKYLEEKN